MDTRLIVVIGKIQKEQQVNDLGIGDVSSLHLEILAKTFSPKFKLPSLDKYDEKADPCSHLANFHTIMLLWNINDLIIFRVFSSTLTGLAQKWYWHLPANSIYEFSWPMLSNIDSTYSFLSKNYPQTCKCYDKGILVLKKLYG